MASTIIPGQNSAPWIDAKTSAASRDPDSHGAMCHFNLSIRRLLFSASCREITGWRPNADEFGLCIEGDALVAIADRFGNRQLFVVGQGDLFFFPQGRLDEIINIGGRQAEFAVASRFDLSAAAAADRRTSNIVANSHKGLGNPTKPVRLFRFTVDVGGDISGSMTATRHSGGREPYPLLEDVAVYSVRVPIGTQVDCLLKPETNELSSVMTGSGKVTVCDPFGITDSYDIKAGDVFCIPAGHSRSLKANGAEGLHLVSIFDQSTLEENVIRTISSVIVGDVSGVEFRTHRNQVAKPPVIVGDAAGQLLRH